MVEALGHRASTPSARTWTRKRQTITSTTKPDPSPHGPHVPLAEVLESAPDAVVGIGLDGLIVFANQQVEALFGYPPGDLIGRPMEMLLPERFREAHRQHRGHYFSSPVRRPMGAGLQLAALRRDGSEFPVDISLSAVETADGLLATAFVRDVTDRRRTEAMFRGLLEAAPDAIVVIDPDGVIQVVNRQAQALFGYTGDELVGSPVDILLPERLRAEHPAHRKAYFADPVVRTVSNDLLAGRRRDGSEFPVDVALAPFDTGSGLLVSAAVRDITERKEEERAAQQLREAEIRRRQALEINDRVVQGVATAVYALERHDADYALSALATTLEAARLMMDGLLEAPDDAATTPTTLVREHPATVLATEEATGEHPPPVDDSGTIRVVVADDTPDMRLVLRLALGEDDGFTIVGEAADGREAIEQARRHQPDVVVLDLAMPVLDGLAAIPLVREASPASKVVVLSGYGAEEMLNAALTAGADAYVTKGRPMESLCTLLRDLCPAKGTRPPRNAPLEDAESGRHDIDHELQAAQDLALAITSHELATPITVLQGMLGTLRDRMDVLPSSVVRELLEAMGRHADHMSDVLAVLNDARRVSSDTLRLAREPVNLATLVRQAVGDLSPVIDDRRVSVDAPETVLVSADAVRLRQVLTNLLTNAVKFSPAHSPIEVAVQPSGSTARVTVTDHGSGMPAERQPQLFMKFSRLGSATSGMGLGLYISRGIIRAHGGELRLVRSGPEGSTFAFDLPMTVVAGASA